MLKIINPKNKEKWLKLRTQNIGSTEVSALFGISPYITLFELWHQKKDGAVVEIKDNDRMKWGRRFEPGIAEGVAEDKGWDVQPMKEYMYDDELKMGSSFDYSIEFEDVTEEGENFLSHGILEVKVVNYLIFRDQWEIEESGNIVAPNHIEIQVQHQLAVSDREYAYIAAFIDSDNVHVLKRTRNENIIVGIKKKIVEFWKSIEENNPPEPNFKTDAEFISNLYGYAKPDKLVDMKNDAVVTHMAQDHNALGAQIKELDKKRKAIKAELLVKIGDAEKVLGENFTISAGMIGECCVSYTKKAYRMFKINFKKEK